MSKVCPITGKRPMVGNKVSHANNKTKRRFEPNLQEHSVWDGKGYIRLRISTKGLRIIDKYGLAHALQIIKKRKLGHPVQITKKRKNIKNTEARDA